MKLFTKIKPRLDGTVIVHGDGKNHVFEPDEAGVLSCEVDDEGLAKQLIAGGNFSESGEFAVATPPVVEESFEELDEGNGEPAAAPAPKPAAPKKKR